MPRRHSRALMCSRPACTGTRTRRLLPRMLGSARPAEYKTAPDFADRVQTNKKPLEKSRGFLLPPSIRSIHLALCNTAHSEPITDYGSKVRRLRTSYCRGPGTVSGDPPRTDTLPSPRDQKVS